MIFFLIEHIPCVMKVHSEMSVKEVSKSLESIRKMRFPLFTIGKQDIYFPPSVYFHENSVYFLDNRQLVVGDRPTAFRVV